MKSLVCIVLILYYLALVAHCFSFSSKVKAREQTISERRSSSKLIERRKFTTKDEITSTAVRLSDQERVQKLIARCGVASRRDAEEMVSCGIYHSVVV